MTDYELGKHHGKQSTYLKYPNNANYCSGYQSGISQVISSTPYATGYLDGLQGNECVKPFGDTASAEYEDGYIWGVLQSMENSNVSI